MNHFKCTNQKCVDNSYVCDGRNDCGDYSDEDKGCQGKKAYFKSVFSTWLYCTYDTFNTYLPYFSGENCPSHAFLCANNECIPSSKVCNGVSDCEDNSDETRICKGKITVALTTFQITLNNI